MVANRPSAYLRASSIPFFMHFVRGFAAWAFSVLSYDIPVFIDGERHKHRDFRLFTSMSFISVINNTVNSKNGNQTDADCMAVLQHTDPKELNQALS